MNIDARSWRMRNMWPLPSGDLAVRPGLRKVFTVDSLREIVAAFSVSDPYTGDVWHYVCDTATSGAYDLRIKIYDEAHTELVEFATNADEKPRVVTHAVVQDQIMISAPGVPTVWGWVGNALVRATKKDSDNPGTTALAVPRGLCVAWANRCVIADGASLYISDPVTVTGGSPRTFIAANQQNRPAAIYGLHVTARGDLVCCTADGVWALPVDAAAAGQVALGTWDKLDDHKTMDFGTTCTSRGIVFGLTRKGYRRIDGGGDDEVLLDEPHVPTAKRARIAASDYRAHARIYGGDAGPIVGLDTEGAIHMHDLATGVRSWWDWPDSVPTTTPPGPVPSGVQTLPSGWATPLADWRLDETSAASNATESIGSYSDLGAIGSPTVEPGYSGGTTGARGFDGSTQAFGDGGGGAAEYLLFSSAADWALLATFKTNSLAAPQVIFSQADFAGHGGQAGNDLCTLTLNTNGSITLSWEVANASLIAVTSNAGDVAVGTWYTVGVSWDNTYPTGERSFFIVDGDGTVVYESTGTVTGSSGGGSSHTYIGARRNGTDTGPFQFFNGVIDRVVVFNEPRTSAEVSTFMINNSGTFTERGWLRGTLHTGDGEEMLATASNAYRYFGNFDGAEALSSGEDSVTGVLLGTMPTPPEASPVVRHVDVASDTTGDIYVNVCGSGSTSDPPATSGAIIGTDTWNGAATLKTRPLRSRRFDFAVRTDEVTLEVGAEYPLSRVQPSVDVTLKGPGKKRRSN